MEVRDACFGDAVLAPELVSLRAVLGVAVGDDVSAMTAADDEDLAHLVIGKFFLVLLHFVVSRVENYVAVLAIVDCFKDSLVAIVDPVLCHGCCWFL